MSTPPAGARERVWSRVSTSVAAGPVAPPLSTLSRVALGLSLLGAAAAGIHALSPRGSASQQAVSVAVSAGAPMPPKSATAGPGADTGAKTEAEHGAEIVEWRGSALLSHSMPSGSPGEKAAAAAADAAQGLPYAVAATPRSASARQATVEARRGRTSDDPAAERSLIEAARRALSLGEAEAALSKLAEHGRLYSDGQLAEERDSLRVRALAGSGRMSEARVRRDAFVARYPRSIFEPVVEAAVRSVGAEQD